MPDLTITRSPETGGRVRYELGPGNWRDRVIPDIRDPGARVQIPENRLIDVVILGDGFQSAADFEAGLQEWLSDFFELTVYATFAGAFRVRALYTPSSEPASVSRRSHYRCRVTEDERGISFSDGWCAADDADGRVFRERLWESVDSFDGVNLRRYPSTLDLGDGNTAIKNATLRDVCRNLVVCLFVKTAVRDNVSGMARPVPRSDPDDHIQVRVAFGANEIHEFSHAFALLSDEYINGRSSMSDRVNHPIASVFTLSNLSYAKQVSDVPWLHLSPWGRERRQAAGDEPDPLVGWLWIGGGKHLDVWHSEYRCLMNGRHDNFQFTQVEAEDPTANPDGTYTDENGARLRDRERFCLWCQEIVVVRLLEKTDEFLQSGDPLDINERGTVWWGRWQGSLRAKYWQLFDVPQQITTYEAAFAAMTPGPNSEPLWQSDLYQVPAAEPASPTNPVPGLADGELFLLLGS